MARTAKRDKLLEEWSEGLAKPVTGLADEMPAKDVLQAPDEVFVTLVAECFMFGKKRPVGYSCSVPARISDLLRYKGLI
jgi:hypothetical protein